MSGPGRPRRLTPADLAAVAECLRVSEAAVLAIASPRPTRGATYNELVAASLLREARASTALDRDQTVSLPGPVTS